jgi:flagella basal body P-ring formation protein FlgA
MRWLIALAALLPVTARAEAVVATHLLRADSVITDADVTLVDADIPGALTSMEAALGQAVKDTLSAGRPVTADNIGPPTVIQRNQVVSLVYQQGQLAIFAEGRALGPGGVGEVIKVMNTTSHTTVSGLIGPDGLVRVSRQQE